MRVLLAVGVAAGVAAAARGGASGGAAGGGAASANAAGGVVIGTSIGGAAPLSAANGVRFGVPALSLEPWQQFDAGSDTVHGFVVDVIRAIGPEVVIIPYGQGWGQNTTAMMELSDELLRNGTVQAAVGPTQTSWHSSRDAEFSPCAPFVSYRHGMLVRVQPTEPGLWRIFRPFSPTLWAVLVSVVVGTACADMVLEVLRGGKLHIVPTFVRSVYHNLACLLGDGPQEEMCATVPGRLMRLGMLLLVLIVQATYTANLASMLTTDSLGVHGPQTLSELRQSKACVSRLFDSYLGAEFKAGYIGTGQQVVADDQSSLTAAYLECAQRVESGELDVIISDAWSLHKFSLTTGCSRFRSVPAVEILPSSWAWYTNNRTLTGVLSRAVLELHSSPAYQQLLDTHFDLNSGCSDVQSKAAQMETRQMGGLFIIFASFCGAAMLWASAKAGARQVRGERATAPDDAEGSEEELSVSATILRRTEETHELLRTLALRLGVTAANPSACTHSSFDATRRRTTKDASAPSTPAEVRLPNQPPE